MPFYGHSSDTCMWLIKTFLLALSKYVANNSPSIDCFKVCDLLISSMNLHMNQVRDPLIQFCGVYHMSSVVSFRFIFLVK